MQTQTLFFGGGGGRPAEERNSPLFFPFLGAEMRSVETNTWRISLPFACRARKLGFLFDSFAFGFFCEKSFFCVRHRMGATNEDEVACGRGKKSKKLFNAVFSRFYHKSIYSCKNTSIFLIYPPSPDFYCTARKCSAALSPRFECSIVLETSFPPRKAVYFPRTFHFPQPPFSRTIIGLSPPLVVLVEMYLPPS